MGIEIDWLDRHQTIIKFTFHDGWTSDDLLNAFNQSFAMMMLVHHPVHFLLDMSNTMTMPFDGIFTNLLGISENHQPQFEAFMAVVTHNKLHLTFLRKLQTFHPDILPKQTQVYSQMNHAVQWLNAMNRQLIAMITV